MKKWVEYVLEFFVPGQWLAPFGERTFYIARVNVAVCISLILIGIGKLIYGFAYEWLEIRIVAALYIIAICLLSLSLLKVLKERILQYVRWLATIQIALFLCVIFYVALEVGSFHNSIFIWLAMIPITMSYFTRGRWVFFMTLVSVAAFLTAAHFLDNTVSLHYHQSFIIDTTSIMFYSFFLGLAFENSCAYIDHVIDEKEKNVEEQQKKLVQTSKFNALGKMAGNLAHEINNPLFSVQGEIYSYRKALEKGELSKERGLNFVDILDQKILNISKIIRAVSSFAKEGKVLEREVEKIDRIFEEALGFCLDRFKKDGVRFHYHFDPNSYVYCNTTQITQVFSNLLTNALDALSESEEKELLVKGKKAGEMVEVVVCDTGAGVEENDEQAIFEPFYTTKPGSSDHGSGTGLGLSISQAFVMGHGGSLSYEKQGKWTCFILKLPLAKNTDGKTPRSE